MKLQSYIIGVILLVSCGVETEKVEAENNEQDSEEFVSPESPDHDFYIDDELIENVDLEFGVADSGEAKPVLAKINGGKYRVLKYEGTLMKASGNADGYLLQFEPYNYYDESLEQEVKSPYDYYLDIQISRDQNNYLGYVISSEETNNLDWDYFENLFEILYYENDGKNYPLKFIDNGKTEWDG
jgi:hypothetical protein